MARTPGLGKIIGPYVRPVESVDHLFWWRSQAGSGQTRSTCWAYWWMAKGTS